MCVQTMVTARGLVTEGLRHCPLLLLGSLVLVAWGSLSLTRPCPTSAVGPHTQVASRQPQHWGHDLPVRVAEWRRCGTQGGMVVAEAWARAEGGLVHCSFHSSALTASVRPLRTPDLPWGLRDPLPAL